MVVDFFFFTVTALPTYHTGCGGFFVFTGCNRTWNTERKQNGINLLQPRLFYVSWTLVKKDPTASSCMNAGRSSIRRTHIHEALQEVCHRLNRNSDKRNHKLVCWETQLKIYIPNLANLWSKVMEIMNPPLKSWLWRGGEELQSATFKNKSRAPYAPTIK